MAGLNQAFIVLVLRFVQGILALIVLGLTAYGTLPSHNTPSLPLITPAALRPPAQPI